VEAPVTTHEERVMSFADLRITYDDRVLEPRPWTTAQSLWAEELLAFAPPGPVLELCSGVGHIGLLAVRRTCRRLVCVDVDPTACEFLRRNAAEAGVRAEVRLGPMDEVLERGEQFALVVADPPWVPSDGVGAFPEDPVRAIDGGSDGLDLTRTCLAVAAGHLLPGGSLVLQVGPDQGDAAAELVAAHDELRYVETRVFERGALLRVDRRADRL
jgi:methylase of polypeptide subunit release factors